MSGVLPSGAGSLYGDGGRRDSDGGSCWRPLRVVRQPLRPRGPYKRPRWESAKSAWEWNPLSSQGARQASGYH